jgi:CDP-glucose 4,6-dehydratase
MAKMNNNFWKNKKVFITGHTGFKGSWLCLWLKYLGADIKGYSLPLSKNDFLFKKLNLHKDLKSIYADICDLKKLKKSINSYNPDIIFHLAAQPLVIESYKNPLNTFNTNIIGTANVLQSCIGVTNLKSIVIVTTDKCYENLNMQHNFKETDKLGGDDPYSASKAATEIIANSYIKSFLSNIGIATARSGNVIGGGDRGRDRLVPDIIEAIKKNNRLSLRNPKSTRPWQHVFETLNGYLILSEKLYYNKKKYSGAWNFGPSHKKISTKNIVMKIAKIWGSALKISVSPKTKFKEKKYLSLNSRKSNSMLKWGNKLKIDETISLIVQWEKQNYYKKNIHEYSINQLIGFINK